MRKQTRFQCIAVISVVISVFSDALLLCKSTSFFEQAVFVFIPQKAHLCVRMLTEQWLMSSRRTLTGTLLSNFRLCVDGWRPIRLAALSLLRYTWTASRWKASWSSFHLSDDEKSRNSEPSRQWWRQTSAPPFFGSNIDPVCCYVLIHPINAAHMIVVSFYECRLINRHKLFFFGRVTQHF